LQETEWVLRSRYHLGKTDIIAAISALLDTTEIAFEDEPTVEETLFVWKDAGADFSGCLIGTHNRRSGCRATATLDTRAAALSSFVGVK